MTQQFPAGTTVGLVPMSAKPFHMGHYAVVERAARENDYVLLYISTSDRKRSGEVAISGQTMLQIWKQYLESIMPSNVEVEYGGSPVRKVYDQVGSENERFEAGDHDVATYTIYSGEEDLSSNFPEANRMRYMDAMYEAGMVDFVVTERLMSGTRMRQLIASGDKESFMSFLPDPLSDQAREAIWHLLNA